MLPVCGVRRCRSSCLLFAGAGLLARLHHVREFWGRGVLCLFQLLEAAVDLDGQSDLGGALCTGGLGGESNVRQGLVVVNHLKVNGGNYKYVIQVCGGDQKLISKH